MPTLQKPFSFLGCGLDSYCHHSPFGHPLRLFGRMLSLLIHLEDRPFSPSWVSSPVNDQCRLHPRFLGESPCSITQVKFSFKLRQSIPRPLADVLSALHHRQLCHQCSRNSSSKSRNRHSSPSPNPRIPLLRIRHPNTLSLPPLHHLPHSCPPQQPNGNPNEG